MTEQDSGAIDDLIIRAQQHSVFSEKSAYFIASLRRLLIAEGWKPTVPHD